MGRTLKIRGTNFSSISIGNTNDVLGDTDWVLGTHDYMNQFGPGGQLSNGVIWFGDSFTGGTSFFSGKTFSKCICRFQEAEHGTENPNTTASLHIGYCDLDGENFVELTSLTYTYNTVMEFTSPITVPSGKTLYVYLTNKWIKTVDSAEQTTLSLMKGVYILGGGVKTNLPNTTLMFDIYEDN